MKISQIIQALEILAPPALQEEYDNSGLAVGNTEIDAENCLVCLDVTEQVLDEAVSTNSRLVISHHPLIFRSLKSITGKSLTEKLLIKAIQNNITIYSLHTNLDNVSNGVNGILCRKLGLKNLRVLKSSSGQLRKLVTFCPADHAEKVRNALFDAGAGNIGNYDSCSFSSEGYGSFRANEDANPFVGKIGQVHFEKEARIEVIYPFYLEHGIINAMRKVHPYEEVAYDIYPLANDSVLTGAGMIGVTEQDYNEHDFLQLIKKILMTGSLRHSRSLMKQIRKVAVCGGSGSFLLEEAISQGADVFITADLKYHSFFEAEGKILLIDAGHFETEQFSCELITDSLKKKFPKFAVRISQSGSNPVNYF